jgi:hypothetical protein
MRSLRILLVVLAVLLPGVGATAANDIRLFQSEQQAQQSCPSDVVVWVNLPSGVYHFRGQRWYGATKSGAFVCMQEADRYGYRPTRNGQ